MTGVNTVLNNNYVVIVNHAKQQIIVIYIRT